MLRNLSAYKMDFYGKNDRFRFLIHHALGKSDWESQVLRTTIQRMIIRSLKQLASWWLTTLKANVSLPTIQDHNEWLKTNTKPTLLRLSPDVPEAFRMQPRARASTLSVCTTRLLQIIGEHKACSCHSWPWQRKGPCHSNMSTFLWGAYDATAWMPQSAHRRN